MHSPIDAATVDAVVEALDLPADGIVWDIGCGTGHLLERIVDRWPVHGFGVDPGFEPQPHHVETAGDIVLVPGRNMVVFRKPVTDVDLPDGQADLAVCIGASHAFGTTADAVRALVGLLKPTGRVLLGELVWTADPSPEAAASFDGVVARDELLGLLADAGVEVVESIDASQDAWDAYESTYVGNVERWVAANPSDPAAGEMADAATAHADRYTRLARGALGFTLLLAARRP